MKQQNRLAELLLEKSEKLNLFSSGDRLKIGEKHIPDSLAVVEVWDCGREARVLDIGTGGGLPGLALAVECPAKEFLLMDSVEKKIVAISEVAKELGLENVDFEVGRFEELAHGELRSGFDVVLARAVATLPVLLEYAAGFLKDGGVLYAWKSADFEVELESSIVAQEVLGLNFEGSFPYLLPGGEHRCLLTFVKRGNLDAKFPRRVGVPLRKPL